MDDNHEAFMDDCPPPDHSKGRIERRAACQVPEPPEAPLITLRGVGIVIALAIAIVALIAAVETFT